MDPSVLRQLFTATEASVTTDADEDAPKADADAAADVHERRETEAGLDRQPIPSKTRCPACGAAPTDESVVEHRLSASGYLHDDITLACSAPACDTEWTCGVPIGEDDGTPFGEDLRCDSCGDAEYLVHRVELLQSDEEIRLHLKCPDPDCWHFTQVRRETDDHGVALVGYPSITGCFDGAEPYGYTTDSG